MKRLLLTLAIGSVLTVSGAASAQDQLRAERLNNSFLPGSIASLKLDSPLSASGIQAPSRWGSAVADAEGPVLVRLVSPSVAEQKARGKSAQKAKKALQDEQQDLLADILAADPNARVLGQVQLVMNAVFVEVDAAVLGQLAADPRVQRITPVGNYELDLSETVPYIGASSVQSDGFDGAGVRVAVLDSGIDYYHAAFGGSGDPGDFAGDDPTVIEPGTFPTAKVVGGYDFVGSDWPTFGPVTPDPDPLDDGPGGGHGTHVGHIIGGVNGVAPGADLYAVKVCSSVSSSCSGVALINGMEFAVDPDGDGDPSDAVDIINMSLGSSYGQPFDDDLAFAVDNATGFGVLTVASAGNSADKPYINGTPAGADTALSVAQTQVPSAFQPFINVDGTDYSAVFQPWSVPPAGVISGPVQYGNGAGGNLNGCAAFPAASLTDLVVLVDRGACSFSVKIANIGAAGGLAGIIGLVAPGDPFAGGYGGGVVTIPGYMISQADANAIKGQIGGPGIATIDPNNGVPLVGSLVGSSSRGPQHEDTTLIKPEIGAPGASVSAIAGTGTGEGPFGGTSGAAPMVAGSAALLLQAQPDLGPLEAKAKLMNTGETDIDTDPASGLAPITRIGGGEVRVDRAVDAPAAAWDDKGSQGALSFGFVDVAKETVNLFKTVRVRNYSDSDIRYSVIPTFRYANDQDNGAVKVSVPNGKLRVKAGQDATFTVKLTIDGEKLWTNYMNSGSEGANPAALTVNEYDGYLVLDDGEQPIHMAWHVLPRKAANVVGRQVLNFDQWPDVVDLTNNGVGTAQNDAFSLLAVSPNEPEGERGQQAPRPDLRAVGINTFPVPAGFCSGSPSFVWAFAMNTWERQQHLVPVVHEVTLDTDQDGAVDFWIFNLDASLSFAGDGRQVTFAQNANTGAVTGWFYTEHSMNTGNTVFYVCAEQVGLGGADMLATNVDMFVTTYDYYFGGPGDQTDLLTVTPLGEQYYGVPSDIPGKSGGTLEVYDFGPFPGNSPELGVMLLTNGDRGTGNRGGATEKTEALLFEAK